MSQPVILAVDGDATALGRIAEELRRRYGADYRIVCERGPADAAEALEALRLAEEDVALVLADRACTELLGRTRDAYPRAKRGLLIPWGGWGDDVTTSAIREAMLYGRIDYYVLEPSSQPDEYFHRTITELLLEWQRSDPEVPREVTVVADPEAARTHEIRNLLSRSGVPHTFHSCFSDTGRGLLRKSDREPGVPVVMVSGGRVLDDPSNTQLAEGYGVATELDRNDFELVVVGAGPAGLAAAVYASSEGIDALVVERAAIGGQASSSSRIRNYLGFPRGLSGAELTQRAYQQAWVFGTSFLLTKEVVGLRRQAGVFVLDVSDGAEIRAQSVVLAMGIAYRQLDLPALERLTNRGVFYGTSPSLADAQTYEGKSVAIVGGGNSAGQAAVHLSRYAARVTVVVRGPTLAASMSQYLRDEMEAHDNIVVRCSTSLVDADGEDRLEHVQLRGEDGTVERMPADALFVLIGAHPYTDWLPEDVARDEGGYVVTDEGLGDAWLLDRHPLMFETSMPGLFAVGDVRSRSVKRVAAAAGEGSVVIQQVYRYLEVREPRVTLADAP